MSINLQTGTLQCGALLSKELTNQEINLKNLTSIELIRALLNIKKPKVYAEQEIIMDGSDWTQDELSILGDIGISTEVDIFDDGKWREPEVHQPSFRGNLMLSSPGTLLRANPGY